MKSDLELKRIRLAYQENKIFFSHKLPAKDAVNVFLPLMSRCRDANCSLVEESVFYQHISKRIPGISTSNGLPVFAEMNSLSKREYKYIEE